MSEQPVPAEQDVHGEDAGEHRAPGVLLQAQGALGHCHQQVVRVLKYLIKLCLGLCVQVAIIL